MARISPICSISILQARLGTGLLLVLATACQGVISNSPGEPASGEGSPRAERTIDRDGDGVADVELPDDDGDGIPDVVVPAPSALRRLSQPQYANTVRDLLGADVQVPSELEPDTAVNGFIAVGSSRTTISPVGVEKYETAAYDLAQQVVSDEARRSALVPCTPAGTVDESCLRQVVTGLGLRAFRRPLTTAEVERYAAVAVDAAQTLGDFWAGVEFAIAGLLQSPHFLFRVELGEPDPSDPTRRRYTDWEMASRLSYFLWNSTPDDELLEAAAAGELLAEGGLRHQAERLVSSPRARGAVGSFFTELLDLVDVEQLSKDAELYPAAESPTLGASMREGVLRTIEHLVFDAEASYRTLFDSRDTFVNAELAALYGLESPSTEGFAQVMLPPEEKRVGLLGQAAVLARHGHPTGTSPTLRGKFVRQTLLCHPIPAPPDDVGELPEPSPDARTMRERLAIHRENPACATCHDLMDPIGLALENFDAVGAFRMEENGVTIDPSGELDGVTYADAVGLGEALREHPDLAQCLVRNVYRYASGHIETGGEALAIHDLKGAFERSGHRIQTLLVEVAMSEGFRYAGEPQ